VNTRGERVLSVQARQEQLRNMSAGRIAKDRSTGCRDQPARGPCHCFGRIRLLAESAVPLAVADKQIESEPYGDPAVRIMPVRGVLYLDKGGIHQAPMEPLPSILG